MTRKALPRRRSPRLTHYDYAGPGAYFVTLCTRHHACLFGHIEQGRMSLNAIGDIIDTTWHWLGDHHEHIVLDEQVIMPNHLHGIIFLTDQQAARSPIPHKPLGRLIGAFKAVSTRRVKELPHPPERLWHRNYWDRVIRNQQELDTVREYIRNNPLKWELDRLNPEHRTSVRSPPERRMR